MLSHSLASLSVLEYTKVEVIVLNTTVLEERENLVGAYAFLQAGNRRSKLQK